MATPITLYYHSGCKSFTGRMTPIMMYLDQNDIAYTCEDKDAYKGSPAFACPFAQIGEVGMGQTSGILIALADILKLAPTDISVRAKTYQVTLDAADILAEGFNGKFQEKPERLTQWMGHIDKLLAAGALNADAPTISDFNFVGCAMLCAGKGMEMSEGFKAWFEKMKATKGYKKWEATGVPLFP